MLTHQKFTNKFNLSVYFHNLLQLFIETLIGILIELFNLTNTIGGVVLYCCNVKIDCAFANITSKILTVFKRKQRKRENTHARTL